MIPSPEYLALKARDEPQKAERGDMWLCRRLGIVMIALGVRRKRGIKHTGQHWTTLYHWEKPTLDYCRTDWDENFGGGSTADSFRKDNERWEYLGNIFDKLPYKHLAGTV